MNTITKIAGLSLATMLMASPVLALDVDTSGSATVQASAVGTNAGASATVDARLQTRIANAKSHADQEIDRRVSALNDLNTRVQAMVKVSASMKSSLAADVAAQVSALSALKGKIDADSDIDTLKTDIKSITGSYRIFMLVIPQGRIEVAADKVKATGDLFTEFAAKLQARIAAAQTAGKDVTALNASLTDMNAKISDANVQADAAVSLVASLTPDNGDQAKMQANEQALKEARAKVKAALDDLHKAREDAHSVVQALHQMGLEASASASSTSSANVH